MKVHEKEYIRRLIEKFMDGRTDIDEEKWLAEFFRNKEVPEEWADYRDMFAYFDRGMAGLSGEETTEAEGRATIAELHADVRSSLPSPSYGLKDAIGGEPMASERPLAVQRWGSLSPTLRRTVAACIALVGLSAGYLLFHSRQAEAPLASAGSVAVRQKAAEGTATSDAGLLKETAASLTGKQHAGAAVRHGERAHSTKKTAQKVPRVPTMPPTPSAKAAETADQKLLAEIAEAARKLERQACEMAEAYRQTVRSHMEAKGYKALYDENGSIIYTSSSTSKTIEL